MKTKSLSLFFTPIVGTLAAIFSSSMELLPNVFLITGVVCLLFSHFVIYILFIKKEYDTIKKHFKVFIIIVTISSVLYLLFISGLIVIFPKTGIVITGNKYLPEIQELCGDLDKDNYPYNKKVLLQAFNMDPNNIWSDIQWSKIKIVSSTVLYTSILGWFSAIASLVLRHVKKEDNKIVGNENK